ncbi:cell division protein FtsA [Candidatus Woesebacteria bacterium]|jgi:cell division protein FtsA|nr:cell division protein FtsA [Candidatus Woesebacteria bacterium]
MTTKPRIISAIDIGSSKIVTLIAQVSVEPMTYETTVNIVGVSSTPSKGVKKGQIVDIEDSVESAIASVEAAERMAGYHLDRAYISVGGAHIASQNSTGVVAVSDPHGEVTGADVDRVIDAARAISLPASRQIIHVLPREFMVDGEHGVRDPIAMSGVRLEVETHLITASSAALKNLTKAVGEVGVTIDETVFTAYAASYSTLSDTEKELGCVLIDIGAGTTSVAAFVDGALAYSGALPIGARNITNDLAIGLRVSLDSAEAIKLALSNNKQVRSEKDVKLEQVDISETGSGEVKKVAKRTLTDGIIRPRLNEIFNMVKMELERAGIVNKIPSGAILTGGGAKTYGIEDAARKTLGLPVRVALPKGVAGLIDDIVDPSFSTAVGLILYGANNQPSEREQKSLNVSQKLKLPNSNIFSKLVDTVKELLP